MNGLYAVWARELRGKVLLDAPAACAYTKLTKYRELGAVVIEKNVIYHKTAKGTDAIATRQHGLAPKLRSLLIMVDGKRTYEELQQVSQMLGDADLLLGQLLNEGLIEASAAAPQPPPKAPATAAAVLPAGAPGSTVTLQEAKRHAVRRLTDILGPNADDYCLRIESARNLHDFQVAVMKAEGVMRQYVSAQVVSQFMADIQAHMPPA
jgi:hypothetical protein